MTSLAAFPSLSNLTSLFCVLPCRFLWFSAEGALKSWGWCTIVSASDWWDPGLLSRSVPWKMSWPPGFSFDMLLFELPFNIVWVFLVFPWRGFTMHATMSSSWDCFSWLAICWGDRWSFNDECVDCNVELNPSFTLSVPFIARLRLLHFLDHCTGLLHRLSGDPSFFWATTGWCVTSWISSVSSWKAGFCPPSA